MTARTDELPVGETNRMVNEWQPKAMHAAGRNDRPGRWSDEINAQVQERGRILRDGDGSGHGVWKASSSSA
ncbi:unnamed protein product [Lampetra fluviatilis]